jgi:RNA polymerase sigma-70 factor (sigma-E family)
VTVEDEFRRWVTERRAALRATAFMLCGDWYLADDLVQDSLARVYASWSRVSASGEPDAYARRVLINRFLDHTRRPARREVVREQIPDAPVHDDHRQLDDAGSELLVALRDIPPGQRAVLVLRYWDDLSVEQTAAVLRTSPSNVKSQSSRGLSALRGVLSSRGLTEQTIRTGETP